MSCLKHITNRQKQQGNLRRNTNVEESKIVLQMLTNTSMRSNGVNNTTARRWETGVQ